MAFSGRMFGEAVFNAGLSIYEYVKKPPPQVSLEAESPSSSIGIRDILAGVAIGMVIGAGLAIVGEAFEQKYSGSGTSKKKVPDEEKNSHVREEERQSGQTNESQELPGKATPNRDTDDPRTGTHVVDPVPDPDPEDLQQVFLEEVIPHFTTKTAFDDFAGSKAGLGLNDNDIKDINEDNVGAFSQKMAMLQLWKQKNRKEATVKNIKDILKRYCGGEMPAGVPDRLQDVFKNEIIKAFANQDEFRKFATDKHGMNLRDWDVTYTYEKIKDPEGRRMDLLHKWRQKNLCDKSVEEGIKKIRELTESYLESPAQN